MKGEKKNCLDLKTNQSKRLESGKSFVRLDPSIQDSPNVSSFPEETLFFSRGDKEFFFFILVDFVGDRPERFRSLGTFYFVV